MDDFRNDVDRPSASAVLNAPQARIVERRLTSRVLAVWRELCPGAGILPHISELSESAFGADWWWCLTLDLGPDGSERDGGDAEIGHLGRGIVELTEAGSALVGQTLAHIVRSGTETLLIAAMQQLGVALERRVPVIQGGEVEFRGLTFLYRSALLPFAGDSGNIELLIGAFNGRQVATSPSQTVVPEG